jgi:hypothetical protein
MRKSKASISVIHCVLTILIVFQAVPLQAVDQAEVPRQEKVQAADAERNDDRSSGNDVSPASSPDVAKSGIPTAELTRTGVTSVEMAAMKDQIAKQQKQIEALQAALEDQKRSLEKALGVIAASASSRQGSASIETAALVRTSAVKPASPVTEQAEQQKMPDLEIVKGELEAVADSTAQTTQRLTKLEGDVAANNKATDSKLKQLGNFTIGGDIRIRYEPFFQEGAPDRHRERIRARFGVTGKITDELSGGLALATGSLDDPVSTNQTLTGYFNRKNFGIDKAYLTYKPKYAKFLKLDAGKMAYPWYRTPLTFDNDLNPEGFAQTLSFDVKSPVLKNITAVGFQLPFNELSGGSDSFIFGGQLQWQLQLSSKVRLGMYGAGLNVKNADPIAVAISSGELRPSLPNTNTYRVVNGKVVGYAYKFAYLDAIAKLDIATSNRFPTTFQFDFINNTRGPRERTGYQADILFGRQREVRDLQFGYSFIRIEKDAIIGAFSESDVRASTNVRNHKIEFSYMPFNNATARFTWWIGQLANPYDNVALVPPGVRGACLDINSTNCRDPFLNRLQFDLIYKF